MRQTELKPSDEVAPLVDWLKPEDFAPSETDEKLSDEQIRAIVNMVHERALYAYRQGQWSPEEEAAYFNGALAAFYACRQVERTPKSWHGMVGPEGVLGMLATQKAEAGSPPGLLDAEVRSERKARARAAESFTVDSSKGVVRFGRALTASMLNSGKRKLEEAVDVWVAQAKIPVMDLSATEAIVPAWGKFLSALHHRSKGRLLLRGARQAVKQVLASAPARVTAFRFEKDGGDW